MTADPKQPREELDRSIYVMPSFVTFGCADLARTKRWYVDGLGFFVLAEYPGLVHLRRWRYQDILLVPASRRGDAASGIRLTIAAGSEDLAERAAHARRAGDGEVRGPAPTMWNTVDLECVDPDGHVVVFTAFDRSRAPDPDFSARIRRGYEEARTTEGG